MKRCLCLFPKISNKTAESDAIPTVKQILLYTQYKSHFVRQTAGLGITRRMMQVPLAVMRKYGRRDYMLITLDNFWTLLSSKSPFFMVSWYCQFLLSGLERRAGRDLVLPVVTELFLEVLRFEEQWHYLLVSTISFTLSILQWRRPAAMNRDSSLRKERRFSSASQNKNLSWHDASPKNLQLNTLYEKRDRYTLQQMRLFTSKIDETIGNSLTKGNTICLAPPLKV